MSARTCWVYIMANPWTHVLYVGVTGDLHLRVAQHKSRSSPSFTQKYNVTSLVYFKEFSGPSDAIAREKQIKGWSRAKKVEPIKSMNPDFRDLSDEW